jgi:hypothetical protein
VEYTLKHVSGPPEEPVTLDQIKSIRNMDGLTLTSEQEADLENSIRAARIEAETYLGQKIGEQVWDIILDTFPCWRWRVPLGPLIEVESITFTDEDGVEGAVPTTDWQFDAATGRLWLKTSASWPSVDLQPFSGVRVRVRVGIQKRVVIASPLTERWPDNIVKAIKFRVGTFDNFREDMTAGTTLQAGKVGTFEALLGGDRNIPV